MAGKGEAVTTRFEIDIDDLKAGIQEANRQIRLANSAFKAASSGMDDWGNSADGLSAKIQQLTSVQDAETQKLEYLRTQYKLVSEEQGESSSAAQNLLIKLNYQQATVNRVTNELNSYEKKLTDLNTAAKESADAAQQQKSRYESLSDTISEQEAELKALKTQYASVALEQGEASDAAKDLGHQISRLSSEIAKNQSDMKSAEKAADTFDRTLDNVGDSAKEAKSSFSVLDGAISVFVGNLATSAAGAVKDFALNLFSLTEATEEYRSMQAKVAGSAESFGYSLDFANEKYEQFYQYVADDQMATNAITNLMGMKVSTDTVSASADAAIAVWAAYGDSIPIESLTESMNESAQVAKVTGVLADTINWASRSNADWTAVLQGHAGAQEAFHAALAEGLPVEDAYNAALAACADTQERADLIAQTLNSTYGNSKKTYDELNGAILDANKAELDLKDTQAELAETIQPLQTKFTEMKNKALREMSPAIEEVTDEFGDLIDGIDWDSAADDIGDVMETAADGAKFVVDNIEPLGALVKGAATAWITYKTSQLAANAATTLFTSIQKISVASMASHTAGTVANTAATTANTVATKALSAAQMATPWGLIAGLVGGLVVGLISYASATADSTERLTENQIATDELAEKQQKLNDQIAQNREMREEAVEAAAAEIGSAEVMAEKLDALAQKENKSNSEKDMMKYYVDRLNEVVPDLNLLYDENADKLNLSTEAIRNNIAAQKDLILAQAAQENLAGIAEDLVQAEINLAEAAEQNKINTEALTEAKEKAADAYNAYKDAGMDASSEEYAAWIKASQAQAKAQEAYDESSGIVEDYKKQVEDLNEEYEKTEQFATGKLDHAELVKQIDAMVEEARAQGFEIPQAIADGVKDGSYALPASIEELNALVQFHDLEQKAADAGITVPQSIADGIASGELAPSAAVTQMNNLIQFNDLLEQSTAAGAAVPQYLTDQIILGQMLPADAVQYMKDLITFDDMLQKCTDAGISVPDNITSGVNSGQIKPADAVSQLNSLMVSEAQKSAVPMGTAGSNAGGSYAKSVGAQTNLHSALVAGQNLLSQAKSGAGSNDLYAEGQNAGQGFINGIGSLTDAAWGVGASLIRSALAGASSAQESNSPAKKWIKEGDNAGSGYVIGVERRTKDAKSAGIKLVRGVLDSAKKAVQESANGDLFGISEMKSGIAASVQGIRAGTSGAGIFSGAPGTGQSEAPQGITFIQNNTSPKALSRLDIYRQTKNQLFAAQGRL